MVRIKLGNYSYLVFQVALVVKNLPTSAEDKGDMGSIPGSGILPREATVSHSSIFTWRIPWTEGSGRLQFIGPKESGTTEVT